MKCLMPAAAFMLVMGAAAAEMLLRFSDGRLHLLPQDEPAKRHAAS